MMSDDALIEKTPEKALTQQDLDEAAKVRYLHRDDFVLFRNAGGGLRLTLGDDKSFLRVKAKRCFPFAFSTRYISLRDGNDEEIGIIADLAELPKECRRWIEEDLEMRYFTPRVTSIRAVRKRFGGIEWHLDTDCGSKKVFTKNVHDALTEVDPGHYVISDMDGNRYEMSTETLDEASKARMERLV